MPPLSSTRRHGAFLTLALGFFLCAAPIAAEAESSAFTLSGSYRLRYEYSYNGFRANSAKVDDILESRLLASVAWDQNDVMGEAEMQDSRTWLDTDASPLGTDDVNTLEALQYWLGWKGTPEFPLQVKLGRMTKDIRTRRFVARNRFRNTLNAFTGVDVDWLGDKLRVNAFYFWPVVRNPADFQSLRDNENSPDRTNPDYRFWGLEIAASQTAAPWSMQLFRIAEQDNEDFTTANRNFYTLIGEWTKHPKNNGWAHVIEGAMQWGHSRVDKSSTVDLKHRAFFTHLEIGHGISRHWHTRLSAVADYGSGDKNPNDGQNNRFDTLFGARSFDFGPTGTYGPFIRSNIVASGLRLNAKPMTDMKIMAAYKGYWLASTHDSLSKTGLVNATDRNDRFVGSQLEARTRFYPHPKLQMEVGSAWLIKGPFLKNAEKNGQVVPDYGDSLFFYWHNTLFF